MSNDFTLGPTKQATIVATTMIALHSFVSVAFEMDFFMSFTFVTLVTSLKSPQILEGSKERPFSYIKW